MSTPSSKRRKSVSETSLSPNTKQHFTYPSSFEGTEPLSTPHTVTVLLALVVIIAYLVIKRSDEDTESNVKLGVGACVVAGLIFCAEHLRDTLFIRPHPAIWRAASGLGLFYFMACTFTLFQNVDTMRGLMASIDPSGRATGKPLPEKSYGEACELTWPNVKDALFDIFVIAHSVGWAFKALMYRDVWMSIAMSFLFELMEYTFEFLQPNFVECWWDHWILDFALCNMFGIIVAHILIVYFSSKDYNWIGLSDAKGVSGKLQRLLSQFTPHSWTPFSWGFLSDFRQFMFVTLLMWGTMVVELDAFFLKDIFYVPSNSHLNIYRLGIWFIVGLVGLRDFYAFTIDTAKVKRLGATAWVMLAMCFMELFVVIKFGSVYYKGRVFEPWKMWLWIAIFAAFGIFTAWWFIWELPKRNKLKQQQAEKAKAASALEDAPAVASPVPAVAPAAAATPASAKRGPSPAPKARKSPASASKSVAAAAAETGEVKKKRRRSKSAKKDRKD